MDVTADSLVARAARELSADADELVADVERGLRREVPELWADPEIARVTTRNIAEHIAAALAGLEHGVEADRIPRPRPTSTGRVGSPAAGSPSPPSCAPTGSPRPSPWTACWPPCPG